MSRLDFIRPEIELDSKFCSKKTFGMRAATD